ncbi:MAG: hypothetical protein KGL43_18850 [Burkholderiales bacterium]|nr:hypothetical protein [Burkholderiales bacterium]MDE2455652.1 hypothetical protein [Burkholderiales bacterium]
MLAACAAARAAPAAAEAPAVPAPRTPEPVVQHQVTVGKDVRIDELRVRGETRSIVVKSRIPGLPFQYAVVPSSGAHDPSQASGDGAGQARWHLFSY